MFIKKSEMKKAKDNDLIEDYVDSYAWWLVACNTGRGTTQKEKHCRDLEDELLKRGILTEENVERLRI